MRKILYKRCRESENTYFMFNNFFSENRTVCEIMLKNVVETEAPQMTSHGPYALHAKVARLHALTCVHTATRPGNHMHARMHTQTNKQYLLLSTATMIHERTSMLRYNPYIAYIV